MKKLRHIFPWKFLNLSIVDFSEFRWVVTFEYTTADKNMFKVDNKEMFQEWSSGLFIISLENIFEVCDGV